MIKTKATIAKKVVSLVLAVTIAVPMTGCAKKAVDTLPSKSVTQLEQSNYNTEEYSYIYDTTGNTETKKRLQAEATGVYIKINGDYFPTEELKEALEAGKEIGLIVTPYNYTYESIYRTIDMIKDLIKNYDINLGVYYNIDKYMDPYTIRANVLLGEMFCLKLTANGVYCGFYGSDQNFEEYTKAYPEYVESHSIDLFDKMIRVDEKEKTIDYEGLYYSNEYKNGLVFSQFNMPYLIESNNLNNAANFIEDYTYTVKSGDSISVIADKHNIKMSDLVEYNNIENPSFIQVGDEIILPNQFESEDIILSENIVTDETDQSVSKIVKGIDVSAYQENIKWDLISNEIDFAIVRVLECYIGEDEYGKANLKGCEENNIPTGCYWFSYALTPEEAAQEAQRTIDILESYKKEFDFKLEYPIFIDIEWNKQLSLGEESIRRIIDAAAEVIENHGYTFGVYINKGNYEIVKGCGYPLWMTSSESYNDQVNYEKFKQESFPIIYKTDNERAIWQFSQCGLINGIEGFVDINYASSSLTRKITKSESYRLQ